MKYIYSILFLFFNYSNFYSQSKELTGNWILVKTLFNNGKNLDINSSQYSTKQILEISANSIKINDFLFPASFTKNQIKTSFRTLNFLLKENYLITQEDKDNKSNYYLKAEDFVKKFPEFSMKEVERNANVVLLDNSLTGFEFNNDLSFEDFIEKNRTHRDSKDYKNLNFQIEFILTKSNQIKDIKVLNSIDTSFDNNYIIALKKSSPFFNNLTGKDLIIFKEVNQLKWGNDLTNEDEKKLYLYRSEGLKNFNANKFKKAIEEFSKIKNLRIENNRFKTFIKDSKIKLGISYLATGQNHEACETFKDVGDKTDFEIRNYLLDFCEEK